MGVGTTAHVRRCSNPTLRAPPAQLSVPSPPLVFVPKVSRIQLKGGIGTVTSAARVLEHNRFVERNGNDFAAFDLVSHHVRHSAPGRPWRFKDRRVEYSCATSAVWSRCRKPNRRRPRGFLLCADDTAWR